MGNAGGQISDESAPNFYHDMQATSKGQEFVLPENYHSLENMVDLVSTIIFTVTGCRKLIAKLPNKARFRKSRSDSSGCTNTFIGRSN
jgi:hypothetical protein